MILGKFYLYDDENTIFEGPYDTEAEAKASVIDAMAAHGWEPGDCPGLLVLQIHARCEKVSVKTKVEWE